MGSIRELQFAQRFPFSSKAKQIVKESGFSLGNIPEEVVNRAKVMLNNAALRKDFILDEISRNSDLMLNEVNAFPLAKIFLSIINNENLNTNFCKMFSSACFHYLEKDEKNAFLFELIDDLKIKYELSPNTFSFAVVPLIEFLSVSFEEEFMKLVNQRVEKGRVYLNRNDFIRFVSQKVFFLIFSSLPLPVTGIPKKLKDTAKQLSSELVYRRKKFEFQKTGVINPNLFPPCIANLYSNLLEGKKLSYLARYDLASFLSAIGMNEEKLMELFKNSPDYKEYLARYHIKRILKQNYAPASCAKLKEHEVCSKTPECERFKHPITYYYTKLKRKGIKAKEIKKPLTKK